MAQRRRRKSKPITDKIARIYEIQLWPLRRDGDEHEDGPFEPYTISLSYSPDKLPDDPHSDAVKAEALKVALRKNEGFDDPDELADALTRYKVEKLRMTKSKFYPAAVTLEAQRAAR